MPYTQVNLADIPGKTVQSYSQWHDDRELLVAFTDQTYLLVSSEFDDMVGDSKLTPARMELDRHGDLAVAAGLFTEQERQAAIAARDAAHQQALDEREYDYYLYLKAKYEP
jgi:hypothetical protein